ncbi:hypothetical protein CLI85_05165 [Tannerella forsythia]|nr:hypothetical protein CLI85_05165 [Tannerella forsythia]
MVCINKVKNQIMKKAKWISFGCLLGIILATGSCKETLQNALGKDISVKNREIVFDVQPSALSQTDVDGQDVPELLSGATEEVLYDGILNVNVAAELEKTDFRSRTSSRLSSRREPSNSLPRKGLI